MLVREANCRREDKTELEVEEEQSQDLSPPLFVLRNKQGFAAVERPLPKLLSISMSDGKQQQSPATQPQQQTAAVLDQNVQQVQVQVSVRKSYPHPIRKHCLKFCLFFGCLLSSLGSHVGHSDVLWSFSVLID